MKKYIIFTFAILALSAPATRAQVSINVNIGTQPLWGPVGYDYVDYYYMPDIDVYYSVPTHQYTYFEGGRWVTVRSLPPRYRSFDLYHAHKVVINEPSPWTHGDRYRTEYGRYKGKHDQVVIRDSHEEKYFANPRHPEHGKWKGNNGNGPYNNPGHSDRPHGNPGHGNEGHEEGHGNGHGNGHGDGHGNGHGNGHGKDH